jgi:predicted NBD/HSP70 family sugar kinase
LIALLVEQAKAEGKTGLAISFAGWLSEDGTSVDAAPNLAWNSAPLSALAADYGLGCHLENDVDARAWGEWLNRGQAERCDDMLVINAGSGFALGMVLDGRLRRGARRRAGEVGHWRPGLDGRCGCGSLGCAESLLGGAHHEPVDFDKTLLRVRWLELAVATLAPVVAALDPGQIIATGGLLDHRPELRLELQTNLRQALPERWFGELELLPSAGGEALARTGVLDLARLAQKG